MHNKLPKQLEITMDYLLSSNVLSSWTIQGNEKQTSVIIRFHMDNTTTTSDLNSVKYRRVPPSQMNRDITRMEQRRQVDHHEPSLQAPPQGNLEAHGSDTSKTMDTVEKVKHQGDQGAIQPVSPPVTRSRSNRISIKPSPIPQVDGAGHCENIGDTDSIDSIVHSDQDKNVPAPTVLVKGSTCKYEVIQHCAICHRLVFYEDIIHCCYQCRSMFCASCLSNDKHCPSEHVMTIPCTLAEYTMSGTFPT